MKRLTKNVDKLKAKPEDYFTNPEKINKIKELQRSIISYMDSLEKYKSLRNANGLREINFQWIINDLKKELDRVFSRQ